MSSNHYSPIISATGTMVGMGTTVATAVASQFISTSALTRRGGALIDEAQTVLNGKTPKKDLEQGLTEEYIIPAPQRLDSVDQMDPLHAERQRLINASQTYAGSVVNWPSAVVFYHSASTSLDNAKALSGRSIKDSIVKAATPKEVHTDGVRAASLLEDYSESPRTAPSNSHTFPPSSLNGGHGRKGRYDMNAADGRRYPGTTNSQQLSPAARAESLPVTSTTYAQNSGALYQSPINFEGPSFANFHGLPATNGQVYANGSGHQVTSPNCTRGQQYQSASPAARNYSI